MKSFIPSMALAACAILLFAGGCGSAVSSAQSSALSSVDLVRMTDQMAQSLATDPRINQEIAAHGALMIVCEPVENDLTGEIIPRGQEEMYTARVRILLSKKAPDRFTWIMNRDAFNDLRNQEVELGPPPESVQPRYALYGVFESLTQEDAAHRGSYYLCEYRLTDLQDRRELWTGRYEVKKEIVKGFLD